MRSKVRFHLNGELHEVQHCPPTLTVLDYLRNECRLTGSKEGCAEGDCGACTLIVAEAGSTGTEYLAMNSCILFLAAIDGKSLISVDGLALGDGALHPVQAAMVEQHGSQCGFCTPGFVMSLAAMYQDHDQQPYSRENLNLNLAGNLCRCTGYAPIVRAAEQSLVSRDSTLVKELDQRVTTELEFLESDPPLSVEGTNGRVFAPRTLAQLLELRKNHPLATLVAGATDVGLWVNKDLQTFDTVIHTGAVAELLEISKENELIKIGAAVRLRDALPELIRHYPSMRDMLERFGGAQVRNAGTIGGNIANGSPIGDMPPALIALGARLELHSLESRREIVLEDFFIDYGRQDLKPDEVVSAVLLPIHDDGQFACYKISKRPEQDISALCAGIFMRLDRDAIEEARICFGGMAGTPSRAGQCEKALTGKPWRRDTFESAMQALKEDFTPISDMRASAAYRMRVARNLLLRFFIEHDVPERRMQETSSVR
ncbi:MAG: xanthine dehydrogenase small subunit [Xanthomonadales bacterium]|nr:xanthine dehydrogenase small subunit [Xanthomonadales bacterium]